MIERNRRRDCGHSGTRGISEYYGVDGALVIDLQGSVLTVARKLRNQDKRLLEAFSGPTRLELLGSWLLAQLHRCSFAIGRRCNVWALQP